MPSPETTTAPATARIEVFRPGTFSPMGGGTLSYSAADLRAIADSYDPDTAPAPIVIGHPSTDAPAFGWAKAFDYDQESGRLHATVGDIDPAFSAAVKAGRYRKVSLSFFRPTDAANPVPGTWYPRHIGFLGGAAPAVAGLRNVQFSVPIEEAVVITAPADFGERGAAEAAGLFRMIREFFIEKFGREETDKVLPDYRIEWLDELGRDAGPPAVVYADDPAPARIPAADPKPTTEEALVPQTKTTAAPAVDDAMAAREAALTEREARIAARETADLHAENVSFAEGLVTEGKLLPASQAAVVAILDGLPATEASVSFAAGDEAMTPAAALRKVLSDQPKVVSFGKAEVPSNAETTVSFAADGQPVDAGGLETYRKAKAHQAANPGCDWLSAVAAVS